MLIQKPKCVPSGSILIKWFSFFKYYLIYEYFGSVRFKKQIIIIPTTDSVNMDYIVTSMKGHIKGQIRQKLLDLIGVLDFPFQI